MCKGGGGINKKKMIRKYYDQMKPGDEHKKGVLFCLFVFSHPEFGGRLVSGTERANGIPPKKT